MSERPHVGFVLERSLGHVTHADNLARALPANDTIDATLCPIEFAVTGWPARVPGFGTNWTVRAGLRARRGIASMQRERRLDALFIHTQVPAVLAQRWMDRVPTVVSVDATPEQYDALGEHYGHARGNERVERWKHRLNRSAFHRAAHIVAWSAWAKDGVVDGYGVPPDRVTVIPPGVTPTLWNRPAGVAHGNAVVRILFVGGDLARKGGDVLLAAFARLRDDVARQTAAPTVELHLVTGARVDAAPGVEVHRGLTPNSPALIELYHRSDVFCLPTRADCLPMVLSEAGAAGLAVVSTAVAGIPEIVRDGETGLVVPVGDVAALTGALRTLVDDAQLRTRLADRAAQLVASEYDADANAARVVDLIVQTTATRRAS